MVKNNGKLLIFLVDRPSEIDIPKLNYSAFSQQANTPLAKQGHDGFLGPAELSFTCGFDTAHMSIFSYHIRMYYKGRNVFESMDSGLNRIPGDISSKVVLLCGWKRALAGIENYSQI